MDVVARRLKASSLPLQVVEYAPYPGDIHPLSKSVVLRALKNFPEEQLHGLRRIELRARNGEVGQPYGLYRRQDSTILLHSLPMEWRECDFDILRAVRRYGAEILPAGDHATIRWTDRKMMGLWFLFHVLGHEVGHHFRNQFIHKNGRQGRRSEEERFASTNSERLLGVALKKRQKV